MAYQQADGAQRLFLREGEATTGWVAGLPPGFTEVPAKCAMALFEQLAELVEPGLHAAPPLEGMFGIEQVYVQDSRTHEVARARVEDFSHGEVTVSLYDGRVRLAVTEGQFARKAPWA